MKRMFIVCATIAVMLCSCTKENFVTDEKVNTISATVPTETKTTINGLHVTWSAGDRIAAYNYSGTGTQSEYTLTSGEGTSNAIFNLTSGSGVNADGFRGFYPFTSDCFSTTIRYQINMSQDGVLDGEIPMYGDFVNKGDGTYNIQFHHTCGIIRFVFSGNATKVEKLNKISLNCNGGTYYKDAVKILPDGSLTYENRANKSTLPVNFTLETIPVIDGKRTVDVLMTPMNVTGADTREIIVYANSTVTIKIYNIPVEAGKITTINVDLDKFDKL